VRLLFSKTENARFISHLDLMATMRRALLRAGIALKYSEGFNPHPYMSIALPLPVGYGSVCELMDIGVAGELMSPPAAGNLLARVNSALPVGIEVLDIYTSPRKFNDIKWVGISGEFHYDNGIMPEAAERLTERFGATNIVISKKTKRGTSDLDIAPFIKDVEFHQDDEISMKAKIYAQNPTISPVNILNALFGEYSHLSPDFASFRRTEIFDIEMNMFR